MANLMFGFAAGASVKAVYLKRFHDLKYGSFIAAAGIAGIIKLMIGGLIATVLLLTLGLTASFLLALAGGISAATVLFLGLAHRIPQRFFSFWSVINDLVSEWRLIRRDRKMILHLLCLSVLLFVIYSLEVYFAFEAFGVNASLSVSGVITAFDNFASAVKLIPGNLGIKEAIFGIVSTLYGLGINEGIHAAVLHRVIRAVVSPWWSALVSPTSWLAQIISRSPVGQTEGIRNSILIANGAPAGVLRTVFQKVWWPVLKNSHAGL